MSPVKERKRTRKIQKSMDVTPEVSLDQISFGQHSPGQSIDNSILVEEPGQEDLKTKDKMTVKRQGRNEALLKSLKSQKVPSPE